MHNYLYEDPFSRENGNGYLEDKKVEAVFLNSLKHAARDLCNKFKMSSYFYPSKIYYRVDNNNKLTFLDFYYNGMDLIFKVKNGKLQFAPESVDDELEGCINDLGQRSGEMYKKSFLNGFVDIANKELTKAMNGVAIKENYFPY